MNRRQFLAMAGSVPGLPIALRANQSEANSSDCDGWARDLRAEGPYPSTYPAYTIPPLESAKIQSFEPAARCLPRRAWSSIDPEKDRPFLQDLKTAYCKMNALAQADPRSLIRQTWLHASYCQPGNDVHHTWSFLPWHRAFLYYHEQILGSLIGRPDLRLPYWDWDLQGQGQIPQFFTNLGLPTFLRGSAGRAAPKNGWVDSCLLQAWLLSLKFSDFVGQQNSPGMAFNGPHNTGHWLAHGAMRNLETAAADPLFYSHHANVDRFWDYWQQQYKFQPPSEWLDPKRPFIFHDAQSRPVRVTPRDVQTMKNLGYSYESPSTSLCPFAYFTVQGVDFIKTPQTVIANFRKLTLAALIEMGSFPLNDFQGFLTKTIRYGDLLGKTCFTSFPLRMPLTLRAGALKAGEYYVVQAVQGGKSYKLGGFGVLESSMDLSMLKTYSVVVAGCLDAKLYSAFLNDPRGFKLQYGKSKDGTAPDIESPTDVDPKQWAIELLHPATYIQGAEELLGAFSKKLL